MDHANPIERLTARERETLRLASTHMSSKEIARQLGISHRTVDKHLEGAMHKLGVGSRRDATRLLIHEAVLRSPDRPAENPPTQSTPMEGGGQGGHPPHGPEGSARQGGEMSWMANGGPGGVVMRFMIDALLALIFFAVLSAGATAVHWIVTQCEAAHVDHNVILMLKGVHYALVAIDGAGIVAATVLLTFRFLKALKDLK